MIRFEDEIRVVIYSAAFQKSRDFYEKTLGLKFVRDWNHGKGGLGVIYALGSTYLEILEGTPDCRDPSFYIYCRVSNLDDLWRDLKQRIPALEEIQTYRWGHKSFSVSDPQGYKLKFFVPVETA